MDAVRLILDPESAEFRRISIYRFGKKNWRILGRLELEIVLINFAGETTALRSQTCVKIRFYDILIRKQEHDLRVVEIVVMKVKSAMNEEEEEN